MKELSPKRGLILSPGLGCGSRNQFLWATGKVNSLRLKFLLSIYKRLDLFFFLGRKKYGFFTKPNLPSTYGIRRHYPRLDSLMEFLSMLKPLDQPLRTKSKSKSLISIGTCFAEQIINFSPESFLMSENLESTNKFRFAADWGRVTSLEHFCALIELYTARNADKYCKSIELEDLSGHETSLILSKFKNKFIHPSKDGLKNCYFLDISREHLFLYESRSECISNIESHVTHAVNALSQAKALFLTLGQIGSFQDSLGRIYPQKPPQQIIERESIEYIDPSISCLHKYKEILACSLRKLRVLLSEGCDIYLTLSPVPMDCYFGSRYDNVLQAHWNSKTLLYQLCQEVCLLDKDIKYIPTFEGVLSANATSLLSDARHLKPWFRDQLFFSLLN